MITSAIVTPGVEERVVEIPSRGIGLPGIISSPASRDAGRVGVVLLHGWGTYRTGPHDILVKLARRMAFSGAVCLRVDFTGRGEAPGAFEDTDLDTMIYDAVSCAEFLRSNWPLEKVAGVGLCSGANVALGAAATTVAFDSVAAISCLPFQSHRSSSQNIRRTGGMLRKLAGKMVRLSSWRRLFTGDVSVGRVLGNLFSTESSPRKTTTGQTRNLKDSSVDIMARLEAYEGRVLFVWGGADPEGAGARSHYEEFAASCDLDARFEVVESSNHNFYSLKWERELFDRVEKFVAGPGGI